MLGLKGAGYRGLFWKCFLRILVKNPNALEAFAHDCYYLFHLSHHAAFIDRELASYLSSPRPDDVLDEVIHDACVAAPVGSAA
jgi:hypothetical protein